MELTIGRRYQEDVEKGPICVGFNNGNLSKGIIYVDKPDNIKVNSQESLLAGRAFEQIVVESGLEPYDRVKNEGYWRIFLYRECKLTQ